MDASELMYKVRPGTIDSGKEYEIKIATLLSLRCVLEENGEMWMASNAEGVGAFDDVILRINRGEEVVTYMMQLKHQDRPKNISEREFAAPKGDFSLLKYFKDVGQLYELIHSQTNSDAVIQHLGKFSNISFVLFTNRDVNSCSFVKQCHGSNLSLINTNNNIGSVHRLDRSCLSDCSDNGADIYLLTNQVHAKAIDKEIEKELVKIGSKFGLKFVHVRNTAEKYTKFVSDWARGNLGGHYGLTKREVLCKLAKIVFEQNGINFGQHEISKNNSSREQKLWKRIVLKNSITIVLNSSETVKIFLLRCLYDEVTKYCGNSKYWTDHLSANQQNSFYKNNPALRPIMVKLIGSNGKISVLDIYSCLWISGRCPLILEINDENGYWNIINAFKLSKFGCKIIIINNNVDVQQYATGVKHFCSLQDLDVSELAEVLEKRIKLQGRSSPVKLKDVIDETMLKSIKCHDLINILEENFNVGEPLKLLPPYFIPRSIYKIFLRSEILQELDTETFIVSNCSDLYRHKLPPNDHIICSSKNLNLDYLNDIKIILLDRSDPIEPSDLKKLTKQPAHHLEFYNEDLLEWHWSFGSVKGIEPFRAHSQTESRSNVDYFFSKSINIISEVPGMGKSVFMDYVCHQIPPNRWVLNIDLNEHLKYYRSPPCRDPMTSPSVHLRYFNNAVYGKHLELAELLFEKMLRSKYVVTILDGFDEVSVLYKEEIINIIRSLTNEGFRIWLTTRPHEKFFLEKECDTFAMSLKPFSEEDQKQFLAKYFISRSTVKVMTEHVNVFVQKLLRAAQEHLLDSDTTFTGIPLQTQLLADFFNVKFQGYIRNPTDVDFNENFDLLLLYQNFIEQKLNILCEKFGEAIIGAHMFLKQHQSLFALKLVFQLNNFQYPEIYLSLNEYYRNETSFQILQRDGVITIDEEQNVNCIHRTYAEYLGASWLSDNINNEDPKKREFAHNLIKRRFYEDHKFLFNIFDRMLAKGYPLHMAVINGHYYGQENYWKNQLNTAATTDKGGRSILHIQTLYGVSFPREFDELFISNLLQRSNIEIYLTDPNLFTKLDIMGYSPLDYALASRCLIFAETLCKKANNLYIRTEINPNSSRVIIKYSILLDYQYLFRTLMRYLVFNDLLLRQIHKDVTIQEYTELQIYSSTNFHGKSSFMNQFRNVTTLQYVNTYSNIEDDLHFITCFGTHQDVQRILTKSVDINETDINRNTPLHYAVLHEKLNTIKILLANQAGVNVQNKDGNTPLHFAFFYFNGTIINLLLSKHADVNIQNKKGETVLHLAAAQNNTGNFLRKFFKRPIIKLLLSKQANVNLGNEEGDTPLHVAVKNKNHIAITKLLAAGAIVNRQENCGNTPLHLALIKSNQWVINTLIAHNVDVSIGNKRGETVLYDASEKGLNSLAIMFLSKGADINGKNNSGNTALHVASKEGHADTVRLLIKNGANTNTTNIYNETALHFAAKKGHCDVAAVLLSEGIDPNVLNEVGKTALLAAVCQDVYMVNSGIIKLLISSATNLNLTDRKGRTVLHCAAKYGNSSAVAELLASDVNVNQRDLKMNTSLHLTLKAKKMRRFKLRLSDSKSLSIVNTEQRLDITYLTNKCYNIATDLLKSENSESPNSLLYMVAMKGHIEVAKLLIEHGADVNVKNKTGSTPLHYAAENFFNDIVIKLLDCGADIDTQDDQGDTALNLAYRKGHRSTVQLLVSFGAKYTMVDKRGSPQNKQLSNTQT